MKNKKGFTLIELLAVIVILAVIALIATPIILNMINDARKSAAKSAALGYIDTIEYNNGFAQLGTDANLTEKYTEVKSGDVAQVNQALGSHLKGKKPTSGNVTIDTKGKVTAATLCFNGYNVTYDGTEATVNGKCNGSGNSGSNEQSSYTYNGFGWEQDPIVRNATAEEIENSYCDPDNDLYYEYDSDTNKCKTCPEGYEFSGSKCTSWLFVEGKNTVYSNSYMWIQENNATGEKELCGKTENNYTVCFKPGEWTGVEEVYNEQSGEYELQISDEHLRTKVNEMKANGFECDEYGCHTEPSYLRIDLGDTITMDSSHYGEHCTLTSDGNYNCYLE